MFTEKQKERFWSNVDKTSDCWLWKLSVDRYGYGKVKINGVMSISHRIAYEISSGFKPNKHILHSCDNPRCCNPSHLFEGTHEDNMKDCVKKGRATGGRTGRKFTEEQRGMIYADYLSGIPKHAVSRKYGCSPRSVRDIVKNYEQKERK